MSFTEVSLNVCVSGRGSTTYIIDCTIPSKAYKYKHYLLSCFMGQMKQQCEEQRECNV